MEAQRFEFDESQHPRDEAGRFTDAEGGERVIPSREDSTRSLSPEAHGWLYHYQWGDLGVNAAEVRNPVPSDKVIRELAPYVGKADAKVLYRAEYTDVPRDPNQQITSWSRYENDVRRIVEGNERPMRIVHEVIPRERIIVDTTRLPGAYRREHDANQNEVIVAHGKLAERLLRVRGQKFAAAKPSVSVSLAEEAPAIHDDLASIFEEAYRTAGVNVSRLRGVGVALTNAKQHAEAYARARAGDLITDIDETTQERVQRVIGNAMRDGTSETEVSDKLAGLFGEQRADLIARTETATAFNLGTVQALKDAGEEYVFVTDGDQYDEECVNADGEIWTLEEAEANPLEHPNCQRDFRPLTEDELAEVKAEEEADEAEGFAARVAARQEARLRRAEFYSPDQERDERGRWESAGGGGGETAKDARDALHNYTGDSGEINEYLRHGGEASNRVHRDIGHIDSLMKPTASPMTVYRTLPSKYVEGVKVGDRVSDPAFVSTSLTPKIWDTGDLAPPREGGEWARVRIDLPAGTPTIDVNALLGHDAPFPEQHEILLGRGLHMKVVGVTGDGRVHLTLGASFADVARGLLAAGSEVRELQAQFYSEDQPRDENGRWTDGGGGEAKPSESVKSAPFVRMKDLPPELQKIRREQNAARSKAFKEREKARREAEKLKPPPPPPPPPPEPPQPRPEPPEPKQPEPVPPTPKEPEGKEGWRPKEVEGPTGSPRQIEDRATGLYVHVEKAPEGSTTTFVPPGPNSENGHLQLARDEKGFTITLALRPGDETPLYTRYREWTEKQRYREYMRSVQVAYAEKKAERQRLRDAAAAARGPSSPKLPTGSDRKEQRTAEYFRNLLAAGMPPEHLDGLGEIRLDTPGINRLTGEKEGGHYSAGRSEIVISNEMRHGAEWGLAHEIGHHVHLTRLTAAAADEWARISYSGGSCRMSNYGKQNTGEHFAEAYKAYFGAQEWVSNRLNQTSISKYDIGVDFNREKLRLEEPKAFAFMERLAKKDSGMLLPIGRRFPVHLQDTRYLQKFHEKSPNRQDRSYRPLTGRTRRRRS